MKFRTIKQGKNTVRKYPDKGGNNVIMTLKERRKQHLLRHPNDKNIKNPNKGIFWGKKKKGGKK